MRCSQNKSLQSRAPGLCVGEAWHRGYPRLPFQLNLSRAFGPAEL